MKGADCRHSRASRPFFLLTALTLILITGLAHAQKPDKTPRDTLKYQKKSSAFYDSVYHRFQRHGLTRLIYPIAFRAPSAYNADPDRTEKSEVPYQPYAGKVIREITVNTLAPFGTSLSDTAWKPDSKTLKALNSAHLTTQDFVIRHELRFSSGERLDPHTMSENERTIRQLSFIDNVRFVITETSPGSDSVDILVLTKDVWSLGLYVNSISSNQIKLNLYDGNFLGLGDRLSIKISMKTERAPFFRVDGFDYTYHNISGSFINGHVGFSQDNDGNSSANIGFYRDFLTSLTKWAGLASFTQSQRYDEQNDSLVYHSIYQEETCWLGASYPVNGIGKQTRFILAESVYNKYFLKRPDVSPGFDPFYFNTINILTGFSLSWNQYYTTSYLQEFGKPENLPYGRMVQLTLGPSFTDFTQRAYTGLALGIGNLVPKFGYLSAFIETGGFVNRDRFEDGVATFTFNYVTNLLTTKDKRYKFRAYAGARFGEGFNRTDGNTDYYDLNSLFHISGLETDTALEGTTCLGIRAGTTLFSPWVFYGFRFAFSTWVALGLSSNKPNPLRQNTVYGGFGAGILIKNDNLIFPPFFITLACYPGNQPNVPGFQIEFTSVPRVTIPDFVPDYPQVHTLNN